MGWKIIDIENPCLLKSYMNSLVIYNDKRLTIPMNDIDVLLVTENHINMSVNVINDLINNGVCIILCNQKKLPNSYILGYKIQQQSFINFQKQMEWTKEYKKSCWKWILDIKMSNQVSLLYQLNLPIDNYDNLDFNDNMIEAKLANHFFRQLYGSKFNRKDNNLINACLNYGYVIITNMVARSIAKKGLNHNIAFFHGSIYSPFPLAYDIVEIFRIIIDIFVKALYDRNIIIEKASFNNDIKSCLLDYIANFKIEIDGKWEFLNNSIDKVIDWLLNNNFKEHSIQFDYSWDFLENEQTYWTKE